tara:strand:- start:208 stop:942 length:735 start_codon:yes stop_codon:yes gene_type:complete
MRELYEIFHSQRDEYQTRGLYEMMAYLNYYFDTSKGTMVELGSYAGQSTCIFSQYFRKVIAVDPWKGYITDPTNPDTVPFADSSNMALVENAFDKFAGCQSNIEKRKGYSVEESKTFEDNSIDFVYLDARHEEEYVIEDIEAWMPKIKKHGFIGGHDFFLYSILEPWVGKGVLSKFNKEDITLFTDMSWLVKCNAINKDDFAYLPPLGLEKYNAHHFPCMMYYLGDLSSEERNEWRKQGKIKME